MKKELSQKEIDQRIAVLKRFKDLLKEQRKKFNEYLIVLETQEQSIDEENIDAIIHHTELEQSIIGDIFTIQKVIEPIEKMCRFSSPEKDDEDIAKLKDDLDKLQVRVIDQNKKNRNLLQLRMHDLQEELVSLRTMQAYAPTGFSNSKEETSASIVDIRI